MNTDLFLAGLGLTASLGLAVALWVAVGIEWWRERRNTHKEATMGALSTRLNELAMDLRAMAGDVTPGVWQRLRPLASEAEELAVLARQSEALEARAIEHLYTGGDEACQPHRDTTPALPAAS